MFMQALDIHLGTHTFLTEENVGNPLMLSRQCKKSPIVLS